MKRKSDDSAIKAYRKAVSAFFRKARSMTNRGYVIDATLPKEPKKITEASIRRIKKVSSELYKKSSFVTEEGKVISGEEGRKYERSKAAKKGAETRRRKKIISGGDSFKYDWQIALEWLYDLMEQVSAHGSDHLKAAFADIINSAVVRTSEKDVGLAIVNAKPDILSTIQEIASIPPSKQAPWNLQYMMAINRLSQLLGGGVFSAQQWNDLADADEDGAYEYR